MSSPLPSKKGANADMTARGKTPQTEKGREEMWVRWITQRNHGEFDTLHMGLDLPEEFDVFCSIHKGIISPPRQK